METKLRPVGIPLWVVAALVTPLVAGDGSVQGTAGKESLRVGTFDRTAILVAYYRSGVHAKHLTELTDEFQKAKAAGDDTKAAGGGSR